MNDLQKNENAVMDQARIDSARSITTLVYALQAASFIIGITYFAAIVVNYVKRPDVSGTWLETHFAWQIRTFWYSLLWGFIGLITFALVIGYFILIADTIWYIYRIVKGWLYLSDGKPMPE